MMRYILKRLLLVIPTLFFIMLLNFVVVQFAPGGPIEQAIANLSGEGGGVDQRINRGAGELRNTSSYRGSQGLDEDYIAELRERFGFDKPWYQRFGLMISSYLRWDFGDSYFRDQSVASLVISKLPVSISLGFWSTLIIYLVSIPLGIRKAVRDGSRFDLTSSLLLTVAVAIPSFLFAVFLLVLLAGGGVVQWFPLSGLTSDNWQQLSLLGKVSDYFWHLVLPLTAITLGGFASLTMLTKNSFLEQLSQQYVMTARAKGLSQRRVLYGHVFRNAMLVVVAGFPAALLGILFTSSLLVEIVFSLDGLGLLGFEAAIQRDYPVMFGTLWIFTLFGLLLNIVADLLYTWVDPRIDFTASER